MLRRSILQSLRAPSVARSSAMALAVNGAGLVLVYALQIATARAGGVDTFGWFVSATVWIQLVSQTLATGLALTALTVIAEDQSRSRHDAEQQFVRFCAWLLAPAAVLATLTAVALAVLEVAPASLVALVAIGIVANAVAIMLAGLVRGHGRIVESLLPDRVARDLVALLVIASILLATSGLEAWQAVLAYTLGITAAAAILARSWARARDWRLSALGGPGLWIRPPADFRGWIASHATLTILSVAGFVLARGELVVLTLLAAPSEIAVYAAALLVAAAPQQLTMAADAAVVPRIARHVARREWRQLEHLFACVAAGLTAATAALALPLGFLGVTLIGLFGDVFTAGHGLFLVLLLRFCLTNCFGSISRLLILTGRQRRATAIIGGHALLLPPLTVAAYLALGLVGAALANLVMGVSAQLCVALAVRRELGIRPWFWRAWSTAADAAAERER